jgi:hypothetical protein
LITLNCRHQSLVTSGDKAPENTVALALLGGKPWQFVGWSGGRDVFLLNPATWAWTRISADPSNTIIPTASALTGTYGRWRYSERYNVFVVVNSIDENVFVYRLTNMNGSLP